MYSVTLTTKSKSYPLRTADLEGFVKLIRDSSIIWLDSNQDNGFWIPASEIIELVFQRLQDEESQVDEVEAQPMSQEAFSEASERLFKRDDTSGIYDELISYNDNNNPRCTGKLTMSPACGDC